MITRGNYLDTSPTNDDMVSDPRLCENKRQYAKVFCDIQAQSNDHPPAYDVVVMAEAQGASQFHSQNLAFSDSHSAPGPYVPTGTTDAKDVKVPFENPDSQTYSPPAGPPPSNVPSMPATTVYNYRNEFTGEVVCSLLPPDHPQMICLQHGHIPRSRFSVLGTFCCQFPLYQCINCTCIPGVLAAIFWFPLGVGICLLDRRVYCSRCGQVIDDGLCG